VNQPVTLTFWGDDKRGPLEETAGRGRGANVPPFTVSLHKFRGPGDVSFKPERPQANRETGEVTAEATFNAPRDYIVRVQTKDATRGGDGGIQCCWNNANVKMTIK